MPYKLTAPDATNVSIIGPRHDPDRRVRIILGIAYTRNETIAEWAGRKGYQVAEVSEIPSNYLDAARRLDAYPKDMTRGPIDAADPDSAYRYTSHDGHTSVDIRHIINGTV